MYRKPRNAKNTIPSDVKNSPKQLASFLKQHRPTAVIKEIKVLTKGDIKVVGKSPHDFAILQQPWPETEYGAITPMLPDKNTVDQAVLVFGVHLSIEKEEIEEYLSSVGLFPKDIVRFTKPQSQEASTTVKIVFGSAELKQRLLTEGFHLYHQRHRVVSYERDPEVRQCFRCQGFGHTFHASIYPE